MTTDGERAFWNSGEITNYFESKPPDPRIVEFLDQHEGSLTGAVALDLGCGGGRHSELLASRGFDLHAVDVNLAMLETTKSRLEKNGLSGDIRFGTILSIPHESNKFDLVVTTGVLHQATSPEEYDVALSELARVTKPAGYVLLNIFTNKVWDETFSPLGASPYSVLTQEGLPMTLLPSDDFNARMARNGFDLIESQGEEIKQENTGPRAVYRAVYQKLA